MQTTIFLNGKIPREPIVKQFTSRTDYIIAADGGANYLKKKNILPKIILGDLDSISKSSLDYFLKKKVKIEKIEEQETTDFEKCLNYCIRKKLKDIVVIGGIGGRADHTLNNISVLKRFSGRLKVIMIDNDFEIFFTKRRTTFKYPINQTVSLFGLPKALNVNSKGLQYLLSDEDLEFGVREGALNKSVSDTVTISYEGGSILLFKKHFIK